MIISALLVVGISSGYVTSNPSQYREPDCKQICNHMTSYYEHDFNTTMSGWTWNVTCQDRVCVAKSLKYSKNEIPRSKSVGSTPTVHFDVDLSKVTNVNFKVNSMDTALRFGMTWEDANLHMCNCRDDQEEFSIPINLEGHIWIPDVTMYKLKEVKRVKVLKPTGRFLVEKWNNTTMVHFSMDLRVMLICTFEPASFPFDRNICYIRVGSYSHTKTMLLFKRNTITTKNIEYREFNISVRALCKEEAKNDKYGEVLDGFKLVLVRDGNERNDMYVLMMHLFLITAGLAIVLPGNPRNMEIDPSEPLIGVAISAYYILYDLQAHTPIDDMGNNVLTRFVEHCNNFIHVTLIAYFFAIYIRRFGKATVFVCKYCWMKIRGQIVEDDIGDEEEDGSINNKFSYLDKALVLALVPAYILFHNIYWIREKNSALSNEVHNRAMQDSCTEES